MSKIVLQETVPTLSRVGSFRSAINPRLGRLARQRGRFRCFGLMGR